EDGAALAQFAWEPDALGWRGDVAIGGTVESVTVLEVNEVPLSVMSVVGVPLVPGAAAFANGSQRGQADFAPMTFEDGLTDTHEGFYTFLAPEGSALSVLAENALMSRLGLWLRGRISADAEGWHTTFALPLVLESGTVFAGL
ncbi:MAG: hypothetical protein AAF125_03845, partial [Chloroflexota bacterium]